MKVAIITDTHFGCRKNSKLIHDYFLQFYENVFFPYLEENEIKTVIDLGDTFDNRNSIDFSAIEWAKENYYDKLEKLNIDHHIIVGNHTSKFKNTNKINSPNLLLKEYKNFTVHSEPTEVNLAGLKVLFIPWINQENEEQTLKMISDTDAKMAMGHLELNGFVAHRGHVMEDGHDPNIYEKFYKVFSGHYHTRSNNGKIFYLGNPYEIYFNDIDDTRGFTIFDTETLEHYHVNNPYKLHYNIYYEDTPPQLFNVSQYENKIVKLIVRKKTNIKQYENFVNKLYLSNVAELKIIENFAIQDNEIDVSLENEDTLSLLQKFIEDSEINLDKTMIKKILTEIHTEACELV
jgi:hypothetical protein